MHTSPETGELSVKTLFGFRGQGRFQIEDWPDPQIGALSERPDQASNVLIDQNRIESVLRFGITDLAKASA